MLGESEPTEVRIPVPWGHVAGKLWGPRDKQPVIAVHGWQDNAGTFDKLAPLLPPEISLLSLDMPGHGFSSPLYPGQFYYHWWDSVQVLRRVVKHYNIEKVSLLGHSRGGSVVFLYAASFPQQVDKLICIDNAFPKLKSPQKIVDETASNIDKFLKLEEGVVEKRCFQRESMLEVAHAAYGGSVTRDSCEVLMRRGMLPSLDKPGQFYFTRDPRVKLSGLGVFTEELVTAYARKISCEYLNIQAEPGISLEYAKFYDTVLDIIRQNARRFELHKVSGTHHLHLNDAASVAPIIAKFLTS